MSDIDFHWHLGSVPDPLGELTTLPRPLSVFKGPNSKRIKEERKMGKGKERKEKGKNGRKG